MTKKLIWRLSKLPTVEELQNLVDNKVITKEDQRGILFTTEEVEERDKKSLENEIKFLKELVDKLSNKNYQPIIETIKYIEKPIYNQPWFRPYEVWCGTISDNNISNCISNFTSIKTF
jgi:hypothetical protein